MTSDHKPAHTLTLGLLQLAYIIHLRVHGLCAAAASKERVVVVRLNARCRSRREGQQRLGEVRGEVQEPRGRLCEGGGEDGRLVEQREGQ